MDYNKLKDEAEQGAKNLSKLLDGLNSFEETLSPKQRQEVDELKKKNPIIMEAKEKLKDFKFDIK